MDGLECSEILLKNQSFYARIDAEFFSKKNLFLQAKLNASGAYPMKKYGALLDCSAFYPSITDYYSHDRSQIPFLRVNEIQNGLISITDGTVFLPEEILAANKKTIAIAYPGDIIIAKGGNTLAKVGLVTDEFPRYATCRDVIILRTNNLKNLNKYYLWAFLHSSYGQGILWRSASQTGQPHLTLPSILEIRIPDIPNIQNDIETLYIKSVEKKHQAESLYDAAQQQLVNELQFALPSASASSIAEKKLSDSFGLSGRLDAEYYQPKYDYIESAMKEYDPEIKSLSDIAAYVFTGEYSEQYYNKGDRKDLRNYIRGTDIKGGEIVQDDNHCINPIGFSKFVSTGDIITGRVGTIGNFGVVTKSLNGAVCSDNILCFHLPSEYIPDVYALYFNSELIKDLTLRMARGSVQQRLNQETLKELPVPLIKKDIQYNIQSQVQRAFELRRNAEKLIDIAVKSVEMAVENGEDAASKWLKENVESLEG